ncbi:MAG: hypothetical protein HY017_16110 [Betaproteobacteria bacterium]|nr:hypothetical protein [Betaproteobacteria bacterium]
MNWTIAVDVLFNLGALLAAGLLGYGGWLSITAPKVDPDNPSGAARPEGAAPATKPPAARAPNADPHEPAASRFILGR